MQVHLNEANGTIVRLFQDDYRDMSDEELAWIRQNANSSGPQGRIGAIVSYELELEPNHYALLASYNRLAIKPCLFFAFRDFGAMQDFELSAYDAFALVTALYAEAAKVLQPSGRWSYSTLRHYHVRFAAGDRTLTISFPDCVIGLLIGPGGKSIKSVEAVLRPVVQKVVVNR